jgi:hypothetical protein
VRGPVGVGSPGFAPSVESANSSLGGMVKKGVHPSGLAGTSYSLEKMAGYIREGRNDPRMRAWAGKVLLSAGKPQGVTAQTQALLDEIRRKTVAMQDPVNTELMAKPAVLLCFDKNLCMPIGDCDDRCIALGSATMSVGIETMVVAQAYGTPQATHVILAVLDPDTGWQRVDPLSDTMPVGKYYPATKEWWMDPITGNVSNDGSSAPHTLGKEPAHGDFVGVGKAPEGVQPVSAHSLFPERQVGVGAIPFNHPFGALDEGPEQGAAYAPAEMHSGLWFPEQPVRPTQNKCCGPEPIFPFITSNAGGLLASASDANTGVGVPKMNDVPTGVAGAPTGVGLTLVKTSTPSQIGPNGPVLPPPAPHTPSSIHKQGVGTGPVTSRGGGIAPNAVYWGDGYFWSNAPQSKAPPGASWGSWRKLQAGGPNSTAFFYAWYPYNPNGAVILHGWIIVVGIGPVPGYTQVLPQYWAKPYTG